MKTIFKLKPAKGRRRGQAMLEFALAIPVFLLLVFGIIEFGRMALIFSSVFAASREAARYGASVGTSDGTPTGTPFYQDCDGMRAAAQRVGFFSDLSNTTAIKINYDIGTGNLPGAEGMTDACAGRAKTNFMPTTGNRVIVGVSANFSSLIGLIPPFKITNTAGRTIISQVYLTDQVQTPTPGAGSGSGCDLLVIASSAKHNKNYSVVIGNGDSRSYKLISGSVSWLGTGSLNAVRFGSATYSKSGTASPVTFTGTNSIPAGVAKTLAMTFSNESFYITDLELTFQPAGVTDPSKYCHLP